jgi:hypothetical protein
LLAKGWVSDTGDTMLGSHGRSQRLLAITVEGRTVVT